jgi:hypothetical protein
MASLNQYGGVGFGVSSEPANPIYAGFSPYGGGVGGAGGVSIPSAGGVNADNLAYTRGAVATDPTYKAAQGFLNPNDPLAMHDVAQHGAEHAVSTGMVGSGQAGQYTGRLRQYDIERRAALGNQLLTGAYNRTPNPVDPYAASRLQLQANEENNRLLKDIQSRYAPASYNPGSGGRSAPVVIGGGGGGAPAPSPAVGGFGPLSGGGSAGSDQIAYGYGGPGFNWENQNSQFYPDEFAPGTQYAGGDVQIPQPEPSYSSGGGGGEDFFDF